MIVTAQPNIVVSGASGRGGDQVYGGREAGCRRCGASLDGLYPTRRYCNDCRTQGGNAVPSYRPLTRPCHNCGVSHPVRVKKYCDECRAFGVLKAARIKTRYGLTVPAYIAIFERQGQVCAICSTALGLHGGVVDHCHQTGVVRGIVCKKCNVVIGYADEDLDRLAGAIAYLRAHQR